MERLYDIAPEMEALRMGMDWTEDDFAKPYIIIESTYGESHPGSFGLDKLVSQAEQGIGSNGGKSGRFYATDICDGIAQGHSGMNYSLLSRELIAGICETHAKVNLPDGMVYLSSCDKAIPAHLIAAARVNTPAILIPGGVMNQGPSGLTLEQIGSYNLSYKRGELSNEEFFTLKKNACAGCGACQFMGTACSMQIMTEALGMSLPFSAITPYALSDILSGAYQSGRAVLNLIKSGIKPSDILTYDAFHNAAVVFTAISGSTNVMLHLPVLAKALGIDFTPEDFDRIGREIPTIVNVRPTGEFAAEFFWYSGGVPALMTALKDYLKLDCLTVTGKTVGENLAKSKHRITELQGYLTQYNLTPDRVIKPITQSTPRGSIAVLKGNLAPEGAVVKFSAVPTSMQSFIGRAVVFDDELSARDAIINRQIKSGDVIVIRYAGPKGAGIPEMFYTTEALASDPDLSATTALITDGRFSGASRGPCIGHLSPEAAADGNIAYIQNGDRIKIDIPNRLIEAMDVDFALRRTQSPKSSPPKTGSDILSIYKSLATSAMSGGSMLPQV